ncbi:MAG: HPr family phosphocarrier protein [Treponema sp.]|nr:HPr family phosphocarrier protein [Treponema sp.]
MKEIRHILKDPMGLHARPAGQLAKAVVKYKSDIQLGSAAKMVNAKRIVAVMALSLKQGQELVMTFNGPDEEEAAAFCGGFLEKNL